MATKTCTAVVTGSVDGACYACGGTAFVACPAFAERHCGTCGRHIGSVAWTRRSAGEQREGGDGE